MTIGAPFINAKVKAFTRIESERGEFEQDPVAADSYCSIYNPVPDINIEKVVQMVATGRYTEVKALIGLQRCGFKFSHDLRPSLKWASPDLIGLLSCRRFLFAMGQKFNGDTTSSDYTPDQAEDVATTVTHWIEYPNAEQNSIVIGIRGSKGGGSLKIATGKPMTLEGEFEGVLAFAGVWEGTFPAQEFDPDELPAPVVVSGTTTIKGKARSISELTLQYGHTLTAVEDGSREGGLAYVHIADRKPTVNAKVRADLTDNSVEDLLVALRDPAAEPLEVVIETQEVTATLNSVARFAKIRLTIPKLDVREAKRDDIGGDFALAVQGVPIETSGNDEFTLTQAFGNVS